MKLSTFVAPGGALGILLAAATTAFAQSVAIPQYNIGDAIREADQTRQAPVPKTAAVPVLPQLVEPQFTLQDKSTLFVRSFQVEGADLVSEAEIRAVITPYENRKLNLTQIYEAADKITTLYRDQGYLLAKAYVPAQDARRGALRIKVVPGKYGSITLNNQSWVRDALLRSVIDQQLSGVPYVHKNGLERTMLLMSDLPGGAVPNVTIAAGGQPETSDFVFDVPKTRLVDGYVMGDNYGTPYTGRNRFSASLNVNSPLGVGDRLSLFGIVAEDTNLTNARIAYAFPVGYSGLRSEIAAFRTTYALNGVFKDLDATGTADAVSVALSYPLRRQHDDSIFITANFAHKKLNDIFFGISYADRSIDVGTATVTRDTIGTLADYALLTTTTVSFSQGYLDFSDPEQRALNMAGANELGNFSKINASFVASLALDEKWSLSANFRGQQSLSGNLDRSEQMSLTGAWNVRSYDEGLSGDTGYVLTPELKYALPDLGDYRHSISLFTDVGAAWLEDGSYTSIQKDYTQLNDVGLSYSAGYQYSPERLFILKALIAQTYGSHEGAASFDRGIRGLMNIGVTF
ncbi:MAG: hemolysin activation/secretion protein-like protein [Tardiphaga sp.]|nr:hemolysin activation/secretion protein-like protein [Tardiphaga sp.]